MSRIKKGDLVKFTTGSKDAPVQKIGVVLTKPKEKPFMMSPRLTSMRLVVDILVETYYYRDMDVLLLEKIEK